MTSIYFNNTDDFLKYFELDGDDNYERITRLKDRKVGFSVQRRYPENIRFKPPKMKNGDHDMVVLIYVFYKHPDESESPRIQKIPLTIRITTYSRYMSNHFDYNFDDEDSPTKESVEKAKTTPRPVPLDYIDEFYYDHNKNLFIDQSNNTYSGKEILNKVFDEHCNTIHIIKGLKLQSKIKTKSYLISFLNLLIEVIPWLLNKLFGRTVEDDSNFSSFSRGYKKENFKKLGIDSINIFGYKASKSVVVIFCLIVASIYGIMYVVGIKTGYISSIFSNSFLAPIHLIILLWFLDVVLPNVLFILLNWLIKSRRLAMAKKFKYP